MTIVINATIAATMEAIADEVSAQSAIFDSLVTSAGLLGED